MSFNGPNNGVWTLQSTAASQKYAPPAGFSAWDSAAPTHSPQALAYLARTVGGDEGGNGANIATLIDGLVSDGVWAKLDALYVLAQQNQSDALLNLVGTNYGLTGAATFVAYKGFSAFPSVGMDTGFNPATSPSPHITQNNGSAGAWAYDLIDAGQQIGNGNNIGNVSIVGNSSGTFYGFVFVGAGGNQTTSPGGNGLFSCDRSSVNRTDFNYNGASFFVSTNASTTPVSANMTIGALGDGASVQHTLSAAFIGASLGAAGQLALYNRLRTYMSSVGVP